MENLITKSVKKSTKEKIKKGVNGSISIFLCILITPFLSIALGLVEYARYQQVKLDKKIKIHNDFNRCGFIFMLLYLFLGFLVYSR
ncbi:MAG: hypothetical protein IJC90_02425 [Clostridia bacterium]|nr:hypothetical protein [Clostridia bacterium]